MKIGNTITNLGIDKIDIADEHGGSRLGLGLCKKIVNESKGEIKIASPQNRLNGSIFQVILPKSMIVDQFED